MVQLGSGAEREIEDIILPKSIKQIEKQPQKLLSKEDEL